jgi:hypothetical protein
MNENYSIQRALASQRERHFEKRVRVRRAELKPEERKIIMISSGSQLWFTAAGELRQRCFQIRWRRDGAAAEVLRLPAGVRWYR